MRYFLQFDCFQLVIFFGYKKMENLNKYLNEFVLQKGDKSANLGSLQGGLWYLPYKERDNFFNYYWEAIQESTNTKFLSFVFRPPKIFKQPLCLDIDIRTKEEFRFGVEYLIDLMEFLKVKGEVVCVQKNSGYFKEYKKGGRLYCSGGHIYMRNEMTLKEAREFRQKAIDAVAHVFKDIPMVNSAEDCVDSRIPERKNGLMLIGTYKNATSGGQYEITGAYQDGDVVTDKEMLVPTAKLLSELYEFVFRDPDKRCIQAEEKKAENIKKKAEKPNLIEHTDKEIFDLDYYLSVSDLKENHEEWLQIVSFCKSNGLDKESVCTLLNAAYEPPDLEENGKLWDSYTSNKYVGIGSIIRLLQLHATETWDENKLFPAQTYNYHNEHKMFTRGIWTKFEIKRFFREVYHFCYGNAGHTFVYKEKYLKNYKNATIELIRNVVTDIMPFSSASTDKFVMITPGKHDLYKVCGKIAKKKPVYRSGMPADEFKKRVDLYTACQAAMKIPLNQLTAGPRSAMKAVNASANNSQALIGCDAS